MPPGRDRSSRLYTSSNARPMKTASATASASRPANCNGERAEIIAGAFNIDLSLDRSAPAGKVFCVRALGQLQCLVDGVVKILLDRAWLQAPTEKVRPEKFAEWRGVLGITTGAPQFAGDAAIGIVSQLRYQFRDVIIVAPAALCVIRMHPAVMFEERPK